MIREKGDCGGEEGTSPPPGVFFGSSLKRDELTMTWFFVFVFVFLGL